MAEVLRSGGDQDVTMRRFLERVSDDEMRSCAARSPPPVATAGRAEACRPADSDVGAEPARSGHQRAPDRISAGAGARAASIVGRETHRVPPWLAHAPLTPGRPPDNQ
jgi:hypothetical protein